MEYYNESYNAFGVDYIWSVVDEWPTNAINVTDGEAEKKRSAYILLKQKISVLVYIIMAIRAAWKAKKRQKKEKRRQDLQNINPCQFYLESVPTIFERREMKIILRNGTVCPILNDFNLIKITDTLIIQEYFIEKHKM